MSLRIKVVLILVTVFGVYGLLSYFVQQRVVFPSFIALEQDEARRNMYRVVQAVDRDLDALIPSVNDWGNWNDTIQFIQGHNPEYVEDNLAAATLEDIQVNVMNFYDLKGNLVWGMSYDLEAGEQIRLGDPSAGQLPPDHVLLAGPLARRIVSGLYMTPRGALLVASKPILDNEGEGPSEGAVLMGRLLTDAAVERLAQRVQLHLTVESVADQPLGRDWQATASQHVRHSPFILKARDQRTDVATLIADLNAAPALRLQIEVPRTISARGRTVMFFALVSLMGVGVLVLLVLLALLQRTVVRPVSHLTEHAMRVGESDDLSARIGLDRKDEIGVLGREFDHMVDRLAEARKHLLEQSYHAGLAEMATGVLHNIGNAVTPLNVTLVSVTERLKNAPAREMEMALGELADDATPERRRTDLSRFVELGGQELARLVTRTVEDLVNASAQMQHVQQILADQARFGRTKQMLEAVEMKRLVEDALRFLPRSLCRSVSVEIDPGVARLAPVRGVRVVLQQVIGNLIINAAEAIAARTPDTPGRIEISAAMERRDGIPMGHFRFTDNGTGIEPDHLEALFKRGFSTKQGSSGLGLHWSANAMVAMGGRLYAESDGPGKGATFHLLLPPARTETGTMEAAA